ncbi:MAG: hypothetical protein Q7U36_00395 [bacterium]|nr:hypothetical protein [bacterium]
MKIANQDYNIIKIKKSGGGGQIVIEYYSKEELNNILGKIK